ncbi:hypothetical protein O3M35_004283 [Rhynocoris fuscipes]|uniref:Uncharacterized protein n=1 Tax=Rhynocoris fuscipes TaxID=488301 RepID=A0AAW1CGQ3_9HEMI
MELRRYEVLEARRKLSNILLLSIEIGLNDEDIIKLKSVNNLIKRKNINEKKNYLKTFITISVATIIVVIAFSASNAILNKQRRHSTCFNNTPPPINQVT